MRPPRETKEARFKRLAEARVNKILHLMRLPGYFSWTGTYSYSRQQVEQIFSALQAELIQTKLRFLREQEGGKNRFSLSKPYNAAEPGGIQNPAYQSNFLTGPIFVLLDIRVLITHA